MKKYLIIFSLLMTFFVSGKAHAFINNLTLSAGEGVYWVKGDAKRTPFNAEVIPSFSFMLLKFDLGLVSVFEPEFNFMLRPGVRVCPPILYFRGAVPLKLTHGFDYGFLLGAGKNLISIGIASIFIEIDTFFTKKGGWDIVPVEARAGIEFGF
jgi:hypothetical protein